MSENLIIFNAKVVTPLGFSARKGKEMAELRILEKATVEVVDGIITYVGPNRGEVRDGYYHHFWHYNARGKCLLPGFVDSHTHFVFGGERAEEFSWRLKGESYMSIMQRGGGIALLPILFKSVQVLMVTGSPLAPGVRTGADVHFGPVAVALFIALLAEDDSHGNYDRRRQERIRSEPRNGIVATQGDAQPE